MGVEIHVKEIRQRIIDLLTTDLATYTGENYVVTDRIALLPSSNTTIFPEFKSCGPIARNLNEIRWSYEFHVWLRITLLDPDESKDAMDKLLPRAVKSLDSHVTLGGYVIASKEEVYKCRVGKNTGDIDNSKGVDGGNNYINFTRIKVFVETSQRGA